MSPFALPALYILPNFTFQSNYSNTMAKVTSKLTGTDAVNAYMQQLQHPHKVGIELMRNIILTANPKVAERVKWNAPSFFYKEDIGAFNVRQEKFIHLVLVFPYGIIEHSYGILEGEYKDRRMAYFYSIEDIENKKTALQNVINDWVTLTDKSSAAL
jgi:hypothetical protein